MIIFLPLLLRLGFWQLERAQEKQQLLHIYQQQSELPVKKFNPQQKRQSTDYQPVEMTGFYDESRYWLLDNKPRNSKVGYEVVMPFEVGGYWVLVNRGWVLAPRLRDQLPQIDTPANIVTITGYFYSPSKNAVLNDIQSDWIEPWPKRVLQLDHLAISESLEGEHYPLVLRIDEESAGAFTTQWPVINTLPEKHQGYAVQWFSMALVLVGLYLWALFRE